MAAYSVDEINAKILKYKSIIEGLEICLDNINLTGDVQDYSFNDGQSQIATTYKTPTEIIKAINSTEVILERWINKLNGRSAILRDADTLPKRYFN